MVPEDISDVVRRFIDRNIDTVPHLEALVLMWEGSNRAWTLDELARRLYVDVNSVGAILASLVDRGLLSVDAQEPPCFQYEPNWENSALIMNEVAATYRRRVVDVATYIHSRGSHSVREFARAFELKKDR
jgi:hypothetical protein